MLEVVAKTWVTQVPVLAPVNAKIPCVSEAAPWGNSIVCHAR